ncbi:MAG: glycoside hydrolase family 5 protein [Candidatus Symbiothrix sp.]|jgi:endoglucanase|nr:glycoside hydrolase family 5 protein [Candidatus Symbiothrix sp.]
MSKLKFFALFCIGCLIASCSDNKIDNNPAAQLKVQGSALLNEKGDTVVLRGVSLGWHNWWPLFYDSETVKWLKKDWHINLIRAAIGVEPDGAYLRNPPFAKECLYKVVDAALSEDLYVIIDWHAHEIHTSEAQYFFTQVAEKYKDNPKVIYEIFNEPTDKCSWEEVKQYSIEVIKTIRAIDPDNLILLGNPHWDQDLDKVAADPITGFKNIMYTLHFYAATHKQYLRTRADQAIAKGIPIFVSECAGMEATGDGPINYNEWQAWLEWMEQHKISWAVWSVTNKAETCSMITPDNQKKAEWTDNDLTEWGLIIKNCLQKIYP